MGRFILLSVMAVAAVIWGLACGSAGSSAGSSGSTVTIVGSSVDEWGRDVVGGCTLPSGLECYEYSRRTPFSNNEATYIYDNCNNNLGGSWAPSGCALTSVMGFCETLIMHGLYVRHYIHTGHSATLATHRAVCDRDNGLWWLPGDFN